jgi:HlyD family secretion protein
MVDECCIEVARRNSGMVLAVENRAPGSSRPASRSSPIGDLADLEIEVELLSADAVGLKPGARATDRALGRRPAPSRPSCAASTRAASPEGLRARHRGAARAGPARLRRPPATRAGLGDAFRVFARIVTWEAEDALQVPIASLFRDGDQWAVYRIEDGRAVTRTVRIGARTQTEAQVLDGLEEGERVVAFPGDRVTDGARVRDRTE